jgi:DNA polymerase III alpha subunit
LEPESKKVDGKGVGKPSDCVEAVRRKPVFKAESIPPDGAVAAEAVAATSIDRLEVHHRQEVTVAGVRLASQRFRANGEASMVLVDMEDRAGIYQVLWRGEALRRYREALPSREPVVIRGRVGADRQGLTLVLGREIQRV